MAVRFYALSRLKIGIVLRTTLSVVSPLSLKWNRRTSNLFVSVFISRFAKGMYVYMSLVVKLMPSYFEHESRVHREISVIKELSHEIAVLARGQQAERSTVNGYIIQNYTATDWPNSKLKRYLHRILLIFRWAAMVRREKADCISCYDISALLAGYLSTLFLRKKPLLVYDAHEFELGRSTAFRRNFIENKLVFHVEKFLIRRCALAIVVNHFIADRIAQLYRLERIPLAIRNIPEYWDIDFSVCQKQRKEFLKLANVDEDALILMYHGAISANRGIEKVIELANDNPKIALIILGNGKKEYVDELKKISSSRIVFVNAVPLNILWQYVGAVDLGTVLIPGVNESYYYMLPNKLFENIQSLTPVLAYNYPALTEIIDRYKIGMVCDPKCPDELKSAIERFHSDKDFYRQCKNNLLLAKKELCWENEKGKLMSAYENLLK